MSIMPLSLSIQGRRIRLLSAENYDLVTHLINSRSIWKYETQWYLEKIQPLPCSRTFPGGSMSFSNNTSWSDQRSHGITNRQENAIDNWTNLNLATISGWLCRSSSKIFPWHVLPPVPRKSGERAEYIDAKDSYILVGTGRFPGGL